MVLLETFWGRETDRVNSKKNTLRKVDREANNNCIFTNFLLSLGYFTIEDTVEIKRSVLEVQKYPNIYRYIIVYSGIV